MAGCRSSTSRSSWTAEVALGAEVTLAAARALPRDDPPGRQAHGRHKKQTGGRGQFGDCHIEIEPIADPVAEGDFEFVNAIKGGVIPTSFIPAVEKAASTPCSTAPSRASR